MSLQLAYDCLNIFECYFGEVEKRERPDLHRKIIFFFVHPVQKKVFLRFWNDLRVCAK